MSQTQLSPTQIKAYNDVFVECLSQLNNLAHEQRAAVIQEASSVLQEINRSVSENLPQRTAPSADTEPEPAKTESLNTETANLQPITENPGSEDRDSFYNNLIQALSMAQQNAVNAQNQNYILAQASLTQGIMQMYSLESFSEAFNFLNKIKQIK